MKYSAERCCEALLSKGALKLDLIFSNSLPRWFLELDLPQGAEARGAASEGSDRRGGSRLGLVGWTGFHCGHPDPLCRGMLHNPPPPPHTHTQTHDKGLKAQPSR